MKLIALMLVRNEEWIIEASLRAALQWCDGVAVFLDRCGDATEEIVARVLHHGGKPSVVRSNPTAEHWDEMNVRQTNLEDGRSLGGTHFAIIDADEILTGNLHSTIRAGFAAVPQGYTIDAQMIAPIDGLDDYRVDDCIWTRARITLGFCDARGLGWAPRGEELYQHHARAPRGCNPATIRFPSSLDTGGVFHFQWVSRGRLAEKHAWYAAVEMSRWPQYGADVINQRYSMALDRQGLRLRQIPMEWWNGVAKRFIQPDLPSFWRRQEITELTLKHGKERFSGLEVMRGYL